jgi:hypothetical protein
MENSLMPASTPAMDPIDLSIIVIYLVGIVTIGYLMDFRQRRTVEDQSYFLAGRMLTWPVIGLAPNSQMIYKTRTTRYGRRTGLSIYDVLCFYSPDLYVSAVGIGIIRLSRID